MTKALRRRLLRALVLLFGLGTLFVIGCFAGVIGAYYYAAPSLPAAETIRDIRLEVPLRIFSRDGYLISEIGERRRIPVTYEDVPQHVVDAFVAAGGDDLRDLGCSDRLTFRGHDEVEEARVHVGAVGNDGAIRGCLEEQLVHVLDQVLNKMAPHEALLLPVS